MITTVPTRTITKVLDVTDVENLHISCFASMNDDGTTSPEIYDAELLEEDMTINDTHGQEGELLITSDYPNSVKVEGGDLIVSPKEDNADDYSKENGDLIYERQ